MVFQLALGQLDVQSDQAHQSKRQHQPRGQRATTQDIGRQAQPGERSAADQAGCELKIEMADDAGRQRGQHHRGQDDLVAEHGLGFGG